jgi:hypothetical protein
MQFEATNMLLTQKVTQMEQDSKEKESKGKMEHSEKEQEFSKKAQEYKERIKKLEEAITEKEKELIKEKAEFEKTNALDQQQIKYLESRQKDQITKIESLQQEAKNAKAKHEEKNKQIQVNSFSFLLNSFIVLKRRM